MCAIQHRELTQQGESTACARWFVIKVECFSFFCGEKEELEPELY